MEKDLNLETYALFLEELGKSNGILQKMDLEKVLLMKDWKFPFKYKIISRIKVAYQKFDNEELIKLLHILMGYHYLEMFNHRDDGNYYGSPTFMQEQNLKYFDSLISDFLIEFIKYNGGNYYYRSNGLSPVKFTEFYNNKLKEIKTRDLQSFILRERQNYFKYNNALYSFDFSIRRAQAYVEPAREKIKDVENKIKDVENKKLELEKKIEKLGFENNYLNSRLKHAHSNLVRMIFIDQLRNKTPYEIIESIAQSGLPLDYFQPLAEKITIDEIRNLPPHLFADFIKQAKKIRKKSQFRELIKALHLPKD